MSYLYLKCDEFPIAKSNAYPRAYSLMVPAGGQAQSLPIPVDTSVNNFAVHFSYSKPTIYVARNEAVNLDPAVTGCVAVNCIFNPTTRLFVANDVLHFLNVHPTDDVRVNYEIYFYPT